jgi:ketosteroid isomerase-like protein
MSRALAIAILMVAGACTTTGDRRPTGGDAVADAVAEESTLRALEDEERLAVLNRDFAALERLWSEQFTVNHPRNAVAPDRAAVLEMFRKGVANYAAFERTIDAIRLSGDHAVVMGGETVKPIESAGLAGKTVDRRYTNVWRREGGAWRLFARQATVTSVSP